MKDYIERWNKWRKHNTNSTIYKMLVFFGILHSPTFERTLSDEEEAELSEAFKNAVEEGKRYMEDYISRKEAIRLIMEYQGGAMDKPTARKVLEGMPSAQPPIKDAIEAIRDFFDNNGEFISIACFRTKDGTDLITDWGYFEEGLAEIEGYIERREDE